MSEEESMTDFTRWNRAGLKTVDYVDGNAATYLELMRERFLELFPQWTHIQADRPADESDSEWKARLEAYYVSDQDDMLWQLSRGFARSCHVLGRHIDAYANESSLGTASQWDSVRKLVAMLDYAPQPPASAYTPLVLEIKAGLQGTVAAGFQVKHTPAEGGSPVLFETLADVDVDARLNQLRAHQYNRDPRRLSGKVLQIAGEHPKLTTGTPLVLENTETGIAIAYLIQSVLVHSDSQTTAVTVSPSLSRQFVRGATLVHALPKEKLAPLGPQTLGAEVGNSLQLTNSSGDLKAGEIIAVSSAGTKPVFRRLKQVYSDRLVFFNPLGEVAIKNALVSRPLTVPLTDLADKPERRNIRDDSTVRDVVFAAGDWSWLQGTWVARHARLRGGDQLPHYRVHKAKYVPVGTRRVMDDEREGFTALTVDWHSDTDDVDGDLDFALNNPQYLLAVPRNPGPWRADTFLQKSSGALDSPLLCEQPKHTAAGDFAVVAAGKQVAWARLAQVDVDEELELAQLTPPGQWQARGGGPFYLSKTHIYSHFTESLRLQGWNINNDALNGTQIPLAAGADSLLPTLLDEGKQLVVSAGDTSIQTKVKKVIPAATTSPALLELCDPLPSGATRANVAVNGNTVLAGHGSGKPERVLGSGDATRTNQSFILAIENVSWVADVSQATGVSAALALKVAGTGWEQVANLRDNGPTDHVFTVRLDEDGHLLLGFGDGQHGRRLPTGSNNVRVSYRQGVGAIGNVSADALNKVVKPHNLVAAVAQPLAASGGAKGESVSDMRENAPATLLTLSRAVSLTDFAQLAQGHASIWQATAFTRPTGWARRESIEVVVVPAEGAALTSALADNLLSFIRGHALPGIDLAVAAYEPVIVSIALSIRVDVDKYDMDKVRESVQAAMSQCFSLKNRKLGQPLYRGELYQVAEAVEGVQNSTCTMAVVATSTGIAPRQVVGKDGVVRVILAGERQCLHLHSLEPQVEVTAQRYTP